MAEETQTTETEVKNIVKIEDCGPCKKKILVEVPEKSIKSALDKQYSELRKDALVPGFRKGRVPMRLLMKKFGKDVGEQVKLKLLADASEAAIKDNELESLNEPDLKHDEIKLPDEGAMKFDFEIEVRPQFELPSLEGIAVEKPKIEVAEKQLDEQVEQLRRNMGIWTPKADGIAQSRDQVIADVVLNVEEQQEDEKLNNIEITLQKGGFVGAVTVENLDEVLAGAKSGDVVKTSVDVAQSFHEQKYRGKKVDIEITVKDVKGLEPAELDENLFNRFGVEDEDELRERISDSVQQQAERDARSQMSRQVFDYLLEKIVFDLPADIVADQSTHILQRQYSNMLMQNLEREQIDQQMQQLRASSDEQAKQQLKQLFIMDKVAEKLEVSVSEEEINGHIARIAASRGRRPEKMREQLLRDGSLAQLSLQIREQKCIERMLEDAKITEAKPPKTKGKTDKKAAKKTAQKSADTESKTTRETTAKKRVKKTAPKTEKADKKADKKKK